MLEAESEIGITRREEDGGHIFEGIPDFYTLLSMNELKALSRTSHSVSSPVRAYLAVNKTFTIRNENQIQLMTWYPPQTIHRVHWLPSMYKNRDLFFTFFPSSTHLSFFEHNSDPVGQIPLGMQQIRWGELFNHPLPPLPPKITHLTFGDYFNQELVDLPQSLTHLVLGASFFRQLSHLPANLTHITLNNYSYTHPIPPLPNLRYMNVQHTCLQQSVTATSFPQLTHFYSSSVYNLNEPLPAHLTYIRFSVAFCQPIDHLPPSLTHLIFSDSSKFNLPVNHLPPTLTHIVFGPFFNQNVDSLPRTLTHLLLGKNFCQPINSLPGNLTHLILDIRHDPSSLPMSLTHLKVERPLALPRDLPPKLSHLRVYEYRSAFATLPSSLTHLFIVGKLLPHNTKTPLPSHIQCFGIPYSSYLKQGMSIQQESKSTTIVVASKYNQLFWNPC